MKKLLLLLVLVLPAVTGTASRWATDILGPEFEYTYVTQPDDYAGPVRSTVVRMRADTARSAAALYIHGFNDYFFQADMAREFADHGYAFYAVDLRKYGRSLMEGQRRFQARDLSEYFADIGHSTGGLIASLYMARHPHPAIKAMVLNSPFLDWNQSKIQERILIPTVRTLAPLMPGLNIPQGASDLYARSLLRRYGGEWDYDTTWKLVHSPAVEASWIAAIDAAQDVVQRDPDIQIPILVMHSDHTSTKGDPDSLSRRCDVVLDVADIRTYGRRLGPDVTVVSVAGGLHDLILSAPEVRTALYTYLFDWLDRNLPLPIEN